jgi:putative ABC transport system ATP-binding protein
LPALRIDQLIARHIGPLSLTIAAGECVSLQGASGSGKTLLLRALADLDPHQGEIYLDDVACASLPAAEWRRSVSLVMAESHWWGERIGDHFAQGINPAWLQQLGLPVEAMDWEVARCSTGERQRLALLRSLMQMPGVILLDEPTGNLDQESTRQVEVLLDEYRQTQQAAMLWVSHDARQIERISQRSLILNGGRFEEKPRS